MDCLTIDLLIKPPLIRLNRIPVKTIGYLITAFAVAYVAFTLHGQWQRIVQQKPPLPIVAIVAIGGSIYSLAFILMGYAWHHMLGRLDAQSSFVKAYWVFSRSQIGKYLPGNILHYAGRQLLGKMCGLSQDLLIAVSTSEIFFQVLAAATIACVGAALIPIAPEYRLILVIGTTLLLMFLGAILYLPRLVEAVVAHVPRLEFLSRLKPIGQVRFYLVPLFIYGLHLALVGAFIGYLTYRLGTADFKLTIVIHYTVIYTIAWTLGFVTPGAPGGIGVREALLTAQMSPLVGASNAVLIALCLRLAAITGDVVLFLTSFLVARPRKHP